MAMRPIHRIKHVVDSSATLTAGATLNTIVVLAKDAPVLSGTTEVETASKVYGLYLKVICASNQVTEAGAIPNVYMFVAKNPGGNLSFPAGNAVGANDNKRFVIHQEMVMLQNQVSGNPTTIFNGVIKIPKGYARMGPNDQVFVSVLSPAIDMSVCLQCHFKEFR